MWISTQHGLINMNKIIHVYSKITSKKFLLIFMHETGHFEIGFKNEELLMKSFDKIANILGSL